jgi:Arc/MetJ family transcription regulator
MRTTLDIDKRLLEEAERALGGSSASKAVNTALYELVRRKKLEDLRTRIGKRDLVDNWRKMEELELREVTEQGR